MDNRAIDVVSEGNKHLALAMEIAWGNACGGKATHYKIIGKRDFPNDVETLVLLWNDDHCALSLPFPLDLEGAINFVESWLKTVKYGAEPDQDGHNEKGWRIYNSQWGHVENLRYGIVAIQPHWAMYGK